VINIFIFDAMRKLLVLFLFCFTAGFLQAQITDNFNDGDFTSNPVWSGDAGNFIVNSSLQLQLNAAAAGTSYLSTSGNTSSLDNAEWQFYIRLNFAPSSNNFARVYLVSDQANLKNPLNGYYLQFGETGSNDAIELFKQTGTTSVSVARGTNGFIASAFIITVKVTRDPAGLWSIYADAAAGTNFTLQATGTDNTYNSSQWFGVVCTYTASNITNFYFDDFTWPYTADVTPPSLASVSIISATQLDVVFDEAVEINSAQNVLNYSVNNSIGNPISAVRDAADFSLVHLTFSNAFQNGVTNIITVSGISDLNNNIMTASSSLPFTYLVPVLPQKYDVVINEIMADPNPVVQLPDFEYLEIYNRSAKTLNLNNWTITAGSATKVFGNTVMTPGSYLIICTATAAAALSAYGTTAPIFTSATTLTNSGTLLLLKDNNGTVVDSVEYSDTWYRDSQKKDGGWSIERINPDFTCYNEMNWVASVDPRGGTPGTLNSVNGNFSDTEPPRLLRAYLTAMNKVVAVFSEPLELSLLLNTANYSVTGIGNPSSVQLLNPLEAELLLPVNVTSGVVYTLTVNSAITDCPGNVIAKNTAQFADALTPEISDVLINEVLYRPSDTGAEFVEIYNRSDKVIDLSKIKIAKVNSDNSLQTQYPLASQSWLMFPGDYYVITKDPQAVRNSYFTPNPDYFLPMSSMPSLTDGGDEITIVNVNGVRIDQFRYSPAWQFPLLNDDKGISLERISINRPTQDSTNWHSASETVGFATPAYKNSQAASPENDGSEVSVTPEIFSPDNDGFNDVVFINYTFDNTGYVANLKIFDSRGREIIHLVKNQLLGTEGSFAWDGITADRQKAGIGIYVIWLEVFHENGTVKKFKKTVVLGSRL
jgi:hypothetical protein